MSARVLFLFNVGTHNVSNSDQDISNVVFLLFNNVSNVVQKIETKKIFFIGMGIKAKWANNVFNT